LPSKPPASRESGEARGKQVQARRGGRGEQNKALRHGVLQELLELAFYHTVPPEEQVIPSRDHQQLGAPSRCVSSRVCFASTHNRKMGKFCKQLLIICEILASSFEGCFGILIRHRLSKQPSQCSDIGHSEVPITIARTAVFQTPWKPTAQSDHRNRSTRDCGLTC
jgi:hypothetical protein